MLTETDVQNMSRLAIQLAGGTAWRNNRGVARETNPDGTIRPVRFGLANDSSALDKVFKTGDLVGLFPVGIPTYPYGTLFYVGMFCMWECKPEGWHFTGTDREQAQWAAIKFVRERMGRAGFVSHPDQAVAIAMGTSGGAYEA